MGEARGEHRYDGDWRNHASTRGRSREQEWARSGKNGSRRNSSWSHRDRGGCTNGYSNGGYSYGASKRLSDGNSYRSDRRDTGYGGGGRGGGYGGRGDSRPAARPPQRKDSRRPAETRPAETRRQYRNSRSRSPRQAPREDYRDRETRRPEPKKPPTPSPSGSSASDSTRDDEIIHFDWQPGKPLGDRHTMVKVFGDGTFGRCVHCTDEKGNTVAIKVIRDIARYVENAKIEVEVLEAIGKADPDRKSYCVLLLETFFHNQFFCLSFEPLAGSLYDLLKENNYRGMYVADIQTIGEQTARCLSFCKSIGLTHTDLKPENILFSHGAMTQTQTPRAPTGRGGRTDNYLRPNRADIKVIDFGNATFAKDHHASIINTRQYRGPEVILGMSWDESSDIWSLGCILMELYGGELFFSTHENLEHLALMERILGPMPDAFVHRARSPGRKLLDSKSGRINWPEGASSANSLKHVKRTNILMDQVLPPHNTLTDLVRDCLQYEPSKRPTADQVLSSAFFKKTLPENYEYHRAE